MITWIIITLFWFWTCLILWRNIESMCCVTKCISYFCLIARLHLLFLFNLMIDYNHQTLTSCLLVSPHHCDPFLDCELNFHMQSGWHDPQGMYPWLRQDHRVRGECIHHYEIYHHLFPFGYYREPYLPFRHHHFSVELHKRGIVLPKVLRLQV